MNWNSKNGFKRANIGVVELKSTIECLTLAEKRIMENYAKTCSNAREKIIN